MSNKSNKGTAKNATILTTISGLAGFGSVHLVEWISQAIASGVFEPTSVTYQGLLGLGTAGLLALLYAKAGMTSIPLDEGNLKELVEQGSEEIDDYENSKTE